MWMGGGSDDGICRFKVDGPIVLTSRRNHGTTGQCMTLQHPNDRDQFVESSERPSTAEIETIWRGC